MLTSDFLRRVLPPAGDGWYCWATPAPANDKGRRYNQRFTRYLSHVVDGTTQCDDAHINTYYAMSSFRERGTRVQDNVAYVKAFWIDIDCGADKAAAGKGYATQIDGIKALLTATKALGLPRPMLVNSGNGVHVYWPLAEAITPDVWRPIACQLVAAYQEHGLIADWGCSTDHSRILRPVGTHNWKDPSNPKPVTLLADCADYPLDSIAGPVKHYVVAVPASRYGDLGINSDLGLPQEPPSSVPDVVADKCAQIAFFRDSRGCLPEPQWRAGIAVVKACIGGEGTVHDWSKGYAGYTEAETDLKIRQTKGPTTCAAFERLDPAICKGCAYRGTITSPIQLGRPDPVETDGERVEEAPDAPAAVEVAFDPSTDKMPPLPPHMRAYAYTDQGMCIKTKMPVAEGSGESRLVYQPFCEADIRVIEQAWMEGTAHMRMLVRRRKNLPIQSLTMPSEKIHEPTEMMKWLTRNGISYRSDQPNAKDHMIAFMKRWFDEASQRAQETRQHTHFGWQDDGGFLIGERLFRPGVDARKVALGGDARQLATSLEPRGDLAEWSATVNRLYGGKGLEQYQLIIAAGFGAPLMRLTGYEAMSIGMVSAASGVGKTTAAKAAMSIWGNPDVLSQSFGQATFNAIMSRISTLSSLPCYVDEITNARPSQLSDLAYSATSGKPKDRLTQSGHMRETNASWNTILMLSGNSSVWQRIATTTRSPQAQLLRVLEYRLERKFVLSQEDARDTLRTLANNFGSAGERFIQFVLDHTDEVQKAIVRMQNTIERRAKSAPEERYWVAGMAASIVGVTIAQQLGLVDFNIPSLLDWCVNRVVECQHAVAGATSMLDDSFGKMINDLQSGILVTDKRGSGTEGANLLGRTSFNAVYGRQIEDEGRLYLTKSAVEGWCRDNNAYLLEMMTAARERGDVEVALKKFRLGVGTELAGSTGIEQCYVIRVRGEDDQGPDRN